MLPEATRFIRPRPLLRRGSRLLGRARAKRPEADVPVPAPWSLDSEALLQLLGSSRDGLTRQDAAERLEREGPSRLAAAAKASDVRLLARQFGNPIMLLLLFAVTVSLVVGSYQDGVIILFIVFVSGLLGFW